jgi:hypothetical protein
MEESDWRRVDDGLRLVLLEDLAERGSEPLDGSEGLTFYWLGWQELSTKRRRSMAGPDPVAYSEVIAWLDENDVRGVWREWCRLIFSRLDAFYLNWVAKKLSKDAR